MDTKQWWKSKAIWGAIMMMVALIAGYVGISIPAEEQAQGVELIVAVVVAVDALIGFILTIYGRIKAIKRIA